MGTSKHTITLVNGNKDHPHAYGDKRKDSISLTTFWGSSPRVWGQVAGLSAPLTLIGIIPTRMGTSYKNRRGSCNCRDHPHAYGDKAWRIFTKFPQVGSSPRVWGQALIKYQHTIVMRDHPHAYGDKCSLSISINCRTGSSPRVWGQGLTGFTVLRTFRIIPTRMGTS